MKEKSREEEDKVSSRRHLALELRLNHRQTGRHAFPDLKLETWRARVKP